MPARKGNPIKRGAFVKLPNNAGSIKIERSGEIVYKAPAPKKKNPTKRSTRKRTGAALTAWVRREIAAGRVVKRGASLNRKKNGAKRKPARRPKGGKR